MIGKKKDEEVDLDFRLSYSYSPSLLSLFLLIPSFLSLVHRTGLY